MKMCPSFTALQSRDLGMQPLQRADNLHAALCWEEPPSSRVKESGCDPPVGGSRNEMVGEGGHRGQGGGSRKQGRGERSTPQGRRQFPTGKVSTSIFSPGRRPSSHCSRLTFPA